MKTEAYAALIRRGFRYDLGENGCIHVNGKTSLGYMTIRWNDKSLRAHRVSYQEWHGPIPTGFHVDHTCHNEAVARGECSGGYKCQHRGCVNTMHLEAKSHQDNMLASALTAPGRGLVGHSLDQTLKTNCPQGHEYSKENTYVWRRPGTVYIARMCRACLRERARVRRANSLQRGLSSNGTPWKRKPKET